MNNNRFFSMSALVIYLAGALNQGLASRMAIWGATPDFLIIAIAVLGLLHEMRFALVIGFAAGLIQGAVIGSLMWQFVVTRMLLGGLAGFLVEGRVQRNPLVTAIVTVVMTLIGGIFMMILAREGSIGEGLKATIISAVYNGVIALLVVIPVERLTGVPKQ